jgi:hypothetical protein
LALITAWVILFGVLEDQLLPFQVVLPPIVIDIEAVPPVHPFAS